MDTEQPKRIALTQVGTVAPEPKKPKLPKTHRFDLPLSDSNDKTCPEFSYLELLKNTLPDIPENEDDPFNKHDRAEEEKMLAMAHSFEQKYGSGGVGVKKPKRKHYDPLEDLLDLGDGYDHTDPFVDNSEAYDELVPSCLTTKHGGFYINSGVLDFKEVAEESMDIFNEMPRKNKKKLFIHSDSESEEVGGEISVRKRGRPKKARTEEQLMKELMKEKKKRKKLGSSSSDVLGDKLPKKRKLEREKLKLLKRKKKMSPTVADLLGQPGPSASQAAGSLPTSTTQNGLSPTERIMPKLSAEALSLVVSNGKETEKTKGPSGLGNDSCQISKSLDNLDSVIDSVICRTDGPVSSNSADSRSRSPAPVTSTEQRTDTKLPHNLPPNLMEFVEELKREALVPNQGKCKFFGPKVNKLLLQVENQSRQLCSGTRSSIYSHLAAHLPCGKETLVKRAKKLRLDQHDNRLREPISRLKEAIQNVMPALMEKHQADCMATQLAKQDRLHLDIQQQCISSDSEDESEKPPDSEKTKRIMAPRKKFEWNPQIKALLNEVVRHKMDHYDQSKVRIQAADEFLRAFLEQEIKVLWPQGWMQTRMLFKESRSMHNKWTATLLKAKKSVLTPAGTPVNKPSTPTTAVMMNPLATNTAVSAVPVLAPPRTNSPGGSSDGSPVLRKEEHISLPKTPRARSPSPTRGQASSSLARTPPKLDYMGTVPDSTSSVEKSKFTNKSKTLLKTAESSGFNPSPTVYPSGEKEALKSLSAPYLVDRAINSSASAGHSKADYSASSSAMPSNMNFMEKFREFATMHQEEVEKTSISPRVSEGTATSGQSGQSRPLLTAAMSGAPFSHASHTPTSQQLLRPSAAPTVHSVRGGVTSSTSKIEKTGSKLAQNKGMVHPHELTVSCKASTGHVHSTTNSSVLSSQSQKPSSSASQLSQGHISRPPQVSSTTLKQLGSALGPSSFTGKTPKAAASSANSSVGSAGQQVALRVAAAVQKAVNSASKSATGSCLPNPVPSAMYPGFTTSLSTAAPLKSQSHSELTSKVSKSSVSSQSQKTLVSPSGPSASSHRVSPTSTVPRSIIAPISRISTQVTQSAPQQPSHFPQKSMSSASVQQKALLAHRMVSSHTSLHNSSASSLSSAAYTSGMGVKSSMSSPGNPLPSPSGSTKASTSVSPPSTVGAGSQSSNKPQHKSSHKAATQSTHVTSSPQIYSGLSISQLQAEALANKAKQQRLPPQQPQGYQKSSMPSAHNTPTSPLLDMGFGLSQLSSSGGASGFGQTPVSLYGSAAGTCTPSSSSMMHGYAGLSKMSPPPLSHSKTPPHSMSQMNRSPDVLPPGSSLYRSSPTMGVHGSPLPSQSPQSPYGPVHGNPHLPLPPNSLTFGQHPYGDISQNQHRY